MARHNKERKSFEKSEINGSYPKVWQQRKQNKRSSEKDNICSENCSIIITYTIMPEAYAEPYQRYKMQCFAKIVNTKKPLTMFAKHYLLDVWAGSEYTSGCYAEIYFFIHF